MGYPNFITPSYFFLSLSFWKTCGIIISSLISFFYGLLTRTWLFHASNKCSFKHHVKTSPIFYNVTTPLWGKCEVTIHTPENGTWESSKTPENSEFDYKGQNTSPWGVFYIVEKVLKRRCRKWPRMGHSDICSTSYVRKKGRESNW
jgi:hypothetical protein